MAKSLREMTAEEIKAITFSELKDCGWEKAAKFDLALLLNYRFNISLPVSKIKKTTAIKMKAIVEEAIDNLHNSNIEEAQGKGTRIVSTTITELECKMIENIINNDYNEPNGGMNLDELSLADYDKIKYPVWANCWDAGPNLDFVSSKSASGIISSLSKKGLVFCNNEDDNPREHTFFLTQLGLEVYLINRNKYNNTTKESEMTKETKKSEDVKNAAVSEDVKNTTGKAPTVEQIKKYAEAVDIDAIEKNSTKEELNAMLPELGFPSYSKKNLSKISRGDLIAEVKDAIAEGLKGKGGIENTGKNEKTNRQKFNVSETLEDFAKIVGVKTDELKVFMSRETQVGWMFKFKTKTLRVIVRKDGNFTIYSFINKTVKNITREELMNRVEEIYNDWKTSADAKAKERANAKASAKAKAEKAKADAKAKAKKAADEAAEAEVK